MYSKILKKILIATSLTFYIANALAENTMTDEEAEQGQLLLQIFEKIKSEYVSPVSNYTLAAGCFKAFESNEEILAIKPDDDRLKSNDSIVGFIVRIVRNQKKPEKFSDRINKCTEFMVRNLDTQSEYYTKEDWASINEPLPDGQAGVGLELASQNDLVVVVRPTAGGSAKKAGIKKGDVIAAINNTSTKGARLDEVLRLITGPIDSEIELSILRNSEQSAIKFNIKRSFNVGTKSNEVSLIDKKCLYIKLNGFQENTTKSLSKKIIGLLYEYSQSVTGIILDLRDNQGGLLRQAVSISSIFLKENQTIAIIKGNAINMVLKNQPSDYLSKNEEDFIVKLPNSVKTMPMTILVNDVSASASEIVAGALQDNKRAAIIGSPTFGSGTVQTYFPMHNKRALKITTANFMTPLSNKIDGVGIKPDILIDQNEEMEFGSEQDIQLSKAKEYLSTK